MIQSKIFNFKFILVLAVVGLISSCSDEPTEPTYQIPDSYSFDNVDYSGQTQRLAMLAEMKAYMVSANTTGNAVTAARLQAMFENDAANANWNGTYDASKQIKDKTFENERAMYEQLFLDFETASQSTVAGGQGQAGVVTSTDGTRAYLMNENGLEYTQIIEKGLMGACFYYQATAVYFGAGKMDVDNETVTPGIGTAMEHHWDEAFGYLGVPTNFPTNTDGVVFWGDYCNDRNALMNTNNPIMDNFIKGRAAISNKDLVTRDEAIEIIRKNWELVSVGTAIHYINGALNNFNDDARRNHALSEAVAFTYALQFNPEKSISNAQVSDILALLGGSDDFFAMNFYTVPQADLEAAKEQLAAIFGLNNVKDQL